MWGYALLGLATLLLAPVFNRSSWIEKTTAWLMIINGILSIVGGFITTVALGLGDDPGRAGQFCHLEHLGRRIGDLRDRGSCAA